MTITSPAFKNNEYIPSKYTCDGVNHNPPVVFTDLPTQTQTLVLVVEDPDAPSKNPFVHWLIYNIPLTRLEIHENRILPAGSEGLNDFGKVGYGGPCPPSGIHHYIFKIFALDTKLDLPIKATKNQVQEKMEGHIIDSAQLIGLYAKS